MARYAQGDLRAFNELHARCARPLFAYLFRLTRDRQQAEDLLQTTFEKLHRARASYKCGAPPLPWLLAIARRSFCDDCRARRTGREQLSYCGIVPDRPCRKSIEQAELRHALHEALGALPAGHRRAIVLTKLFGCSGDEAAAVLGTTQTAIKLRVHRGNRQLREFLFPPS